MFDKVNINGGTRAGTSNLATKIFVLAFTMLFVMAFAHAAIPEMSMLPLKGEVVAIDSAAKAVTVKIINSTLLAPTSIKGELTFNTAETTQVNMCNESKDFSDLKVGDMVAISYHEIGMNPVADSIAITGLPDMIGLTC